MAPVDKSSRSDPKFPTNDSITIRGRHFPFLISTHSGGIPTRVASLKLYETFYITKCFLLCNSL